MYNKQEERILDEGAVIVDLPSSEQVQKTLFIQQAHQMLTVHMQYVYLWKQQQKERLDSQHTLSIK